MSPAAGTFAPVLTHRGGTGDSSEAMIQEGDGVKTVVPLDLVVPCASILSE